MLSNPSGYDRARHGTHNLGRAAVVADPLIYIDAVTELGPLFYDQVGGVWVCTGYAEAARVLTDHRRFSSARTRKASALDERGLDAASSAAGIVSEQMLFMDPPEHAAIRARIRDQFTKAQIRARDDVMRRMVDEALADLPEEGVLDLVGDYAAKLPAKLVAHLLGMEGDEELLTRWADAYERLLGSLSSLPDVRDREVVAVLDEAVAGFRDQARRRMADPGDDLVSALVDGIDGTDEELFSVAANCIVLVGGGYQTLTHLVTTGLLQLHDHPDQLRALREEPELIESAVDEFMRRNGSSQYLARLAVEDVDLGGATIRAGQTVLVHLAAANLDPRVFDHPRDLDIRRNGTRHLGFGMGRHYCVGAPYAERLGGWAIRGFLDRYPHYRPAGEVRWGHHANTRCPAHAPVEVRTAPPALSDVERHRVTVEFNDHSAPLGPHAGWHQVFEHRARLAPDSVAVDDQGREHTYGEIDRRANALAHDLRARGVQPESVVGVVMERTVDFVISVLAVAKAGGAFMLAEPTCPPERLRAMVEQSGARVVLTEVDTSAERDDPPITGVTSGNTAYVVFTSGTTGRPKAIAISHEGAVNLHIGQRRIFRLAPTDRVLQFLSPNFDGCFADLVLALLNGATLVVAPTARLVVGPPLVRLLAQRRVTAVILTPSVWLALPDGPLPDLRVAAAAGERLTTAVLARWLVPGRRFLNLYGPAETAVMATWHECTDTGTTPTIGRPVANKQVYVLDADLRPVPVGEPGELCVGGLGVGRYLGRDELMRERFRLDPFAAEPGRLLYRTGDRARWLPDGSIEYLGRRDRQVKIRGQRVELDEVERVLEASPGVEAAVVSERAGRLEAQVVGDLDETVVWKHLRMHLHSGMVPATLTVVAELPRSITGKADRTGTPTEPARPQPASPTPEPVAALPAPTPEPARTSAPPPVPTLGTAPEPDRRRARLTWRIAQFFATCVGIRQAEVKADSDFFALGGDSLAVATLLTKIEQEVDHVLDVEQLLADPTPARISDRILATA
ncbi:amino acid adenylation domain-containing protein [Saccharothrix luteola]|uniref:amino acid adenylation domain-containing protein n=1 Tax=Saccharothrix luteola TaxID=2893018 RepID=UPI001E4324A2|nr:amino acid adenylation domain-containing protein [Saccharothrix luteola]MCC8251032.1 amino acid adenylation domain-containing protein [Saccharothrix luteola]